MSLSPTHYDSRFFGWARARLLAYLFSYGRDEAISAAGVRFDESRTVCRVSQRFPYFVNGRVEPLIEVNEGALGPEFLAQYFPADYLSWMLDQEHQDLDRLPLQLDRQTILVEIAVSQVQPKRSEANNSRGV